MNELFVLLDTIAGAGWVYLCALLAVAGGLLFFDRQPRKPASDQAASQDRMAA